MCTNFKKVPFSVELWKSGCDVVTRGGHKVTIFATDLNIINLPIAGVIHRNKDDLTTWTIKGKYFYEPRVCENDLFCLVEEPIDNVSVALLRNCFGTLYPNLLVDSSKEELEEYEYNPNFVKWIVRAAPY